MSNLTQPIRIYVYDKDDKLISTVEAAIVKNLINPDEVKNAVDNVKDVIEEGFSTISTALANEALPDAENAIVVEGTNTSSLFDEVTAALTDGTLSNQVTPSIDDMYTLAVEKHNSFQEEANENARTSANGVSGKVKTKEEYMEV